MRLRSKGPLTTARTSSQRSPPAPGGTEPVRGQLDQLVPDHAANCLLLWAAVQLGAPPACVVHSDRQLRNIYATYAARMMGLPIERLVLATNQNDILTRFFESGTMEIKGVEPTFSPSMDIQVSSNFERLLFNMLDHDASTLEEVMLSFRRSGRFEVDNERIEKVRRVFGAYRVDDNRTVETIRSQFEQSGELLDPHTAIGVDAASGSRD